VAVSVSSAWAAAPPGNPPLNRHLFKGKYTLNIYIIQKCYKSYLHPPPHVFCSASAVFYWVYCHFVWVPLALGAASFERLLGRLVEEVVLGDQFLQLKWIKKN